MTYELFRIILGLALLILGAEGLVRAAVSVAARLGISPLLIGLTVVAFGTSTPEVAVSIGASLDGDGALVIGNVVGSNIFNILFTLGLAAVIAPLAIRSQVVRIDVPLMLGASVAILFLGWDRALGRGDGVVLLLALLGYLFFLGWLARGERRQRSSGSYSAGPVPLALVMGAGGLALLGVGAGEVVEGATGVARALGVSDLVVGLTIVAIGTSLPELVTSVVAAYRNQRDLAVGNAVGSNVFNLLAVLGAGAVTGGVAIPDAVVMVDYPVMLGVAVVCLPVFLSGAYISRTEGVVFLAYYAMYMTYLVLDATQHALRDTFGATVVGVIIPMTLAVAVPMWLRARRSSAEPDP